MHIHIQESTQNSWNHQEDQSREIQYKLNLYGTNKIRKKEKFEPGGENLFKSFHPQALNALCFR